MTAELINAISDVLKVFLQIANVVILGYALYKFINKPHDTLEHKVEDHEVRLQRVEARLDKGDKNFEEQDETNRVVISSTLALIEFEIQYCLTEHKTPSKGLERAKEDLNSYLSKR